MENQTKYILASAIAFVILTAIAFGYQQKKITSLERKLTGGVPASRPEGDMPGSSAFSPAARATQKTIMENTKEIRGTVTAKNENQISVNADVVDFSKFSEIGDKAPKQADLLPKTKKIYEVKIDSKTQFPSIKLREIGIGDEVIIFTDGLIYKTGDLTAVKILVVSVHNSDAEIKNPANLSLGEYIKQDSTVAGPIREIEDNYIVIEANWIDYSKVDYSQATKIGSMDPSQVPKITKRYKIFVDDKTVYSKNRFNELRVGDMTQAFSEKPTFSVDEFTATRVESPLWFQ